MSGRCFHDLNPAENSHLNAGRVSATPPFATRALRFLAANVCSTYFFAAPYPELTHHFFGAAGAPGGPGIPSGNFNADGSEVSLKSGRDEGSRWEPQPVAKTKHKQTSEARMERIGNKILRLE